MFNTTASVPPFYWKVPGPEKDYMGDNLRFIRQLDSQVRKKKNEGLKPAFIPGVTRNPKYDHVQSKLSGFLKGEVKFAPRYEVPLTKSKSQSSFSAQAPRFVPNKCGSTLNGRASDKPSSTVMKESPPKPIWGASLAANARRLSKSTTDLPLQQKSSMPTRNSRRKSQAQGESVYNWHFADSKNAQAVNQDFEREIQSFQNYSDPKHLHRVEYLPCDGICAEETIFVKEDGKGDSGRSAGSSARTSRGVNTDETRIFQDPSFKKPTLKSMSRSRDRNMVPRFVEEEDYDLSNHWNGGNHDTKINELERKLEHIDINGKHSSIAKAPITNTKSAYSLQTQAHAPGSIPKYLKQRQQEWREVEDAKLEAERNADIPDGHVLMSESERVQTLKTLKGNYDSLVAELNRIPIRIDTIRVRDQKVRLEEQLTKLEQAMKIFSRSRVYVKLDQ